MRLMVAASLSLCLLGLVALAPNQIRADSPFQLDVPVLMYHRIQCPGPTDKSPGLFVCPDLLDQQMAYLQNQGWHSITASQLADDMWAHECPAAKTFVITVDDGALDGYTNGAPIWEKYGFRATFAMVVGKTGDYLTNPSLTKPHFDWNQARDLVARGHDIANHTMFHTSVSSMTTSERNAAIQDAENVLQQQLGFAPKVFVYPYGSVGSAPSYLSSRFALAFTTAGGAFEATTDPMVSPRVRVEGRETPKQLVRSISGYANPCKNTTPAPKLVVTPSSDNYGSVTTGAASGAVTFVLKNKGSANLGISNVTVGGTNAPEFVITSDRCTGASLLPGFGCRVTVQFGPTSDGSATASLEIVSNDPTRPTVNVAMSGSGAPPTS